MAPGQVVNAQLASILRNQAATAAHFGDADRIAWWQAADHTTPEQH